MMKIQGDIGERIKYLRALLNLTQKEFGEKTKITPRTISRIETGQIKKPREILLVAISQAFGVSLKWLKTGEGPVFLKDIHKGNAKLIKHYDYLPVVGKVGAGFGVLNFDDVEVLYHIPIPAGTYKKKVFGVEVVGSSMEPTMFEGDVVVFEPLSVYGVMTPFELPDGKVVIVRNPDGELIVKRLKKLEDKLALTSDNPAFAPIIVSNGNEYQSYEIIGVGIEVLKRLKL